jgi:co-chaperonin GroES (HSP10)
MAFTARIHIKAKSITPTKKNILVTDMEFGERKTQAGIILPGDDREERGIRPRWCKVLAVGPTNKDVKEGEYILVSHGRWTRGLDMTDPDTNESITVRLVDPKDVLLASDTMPLDDYVAPTYHLRDN